MKLGTCGIYGEKTQVVQMLNIELRALEMPLIYGS
jgi:hypothetical protein